MRRSAVAVLTALCAVPAANAQRGSGDWMTTAFDAQRSSWVRSDAKISPSSLKKPGFDLVWKIKADNTARGLNNLTAPALLDFYISYRGFRALGFFGGSSDYVLGVDTDLARTEWQKNLNPARQKTDSVECAGGMTSAVTRPTSTPFLPNPTGLGPGRRSPAKSAVGEPHEGAALLKTMPPNGFGPPPRRPPPGPAAPSPLAPNIQYVAALTGDGKLHTLWVSNGNEPNTAMQFVPPGADARGLVIFDNTAYVGVTNNCNGSGNGVWALDVNSGKVTTWKTTSNLGGTAGPAAGPDGTLYVAAGSELTALSAHTLQPASTYKTGGAQFTSSPVVFEYRFRTLLAAASADGRIHLLDASKLGGEPLAKSEPFSAPDFDSGSLTSWLDRLGNRWILAAAGGPHGEIKTGAIVAFKVVESDGKMALERAWTSRDMIAPLPPIVVNGVIFAVSSGEYRTKDPKVTASERAKRSVPAVLYGLDANTGAVLWSSGSAMTSFVHSGGLAAGGSKVYVSTYDGTQYAFGYDIEH